MTSSAGDVDGYFPSPCKRKVASSATGNSTTSELFAGFGQSIRTIDILDHVVQWFRLWSSFFVTNVPRSEKGGQRPGVTQSQRRLQLRPRRPAGHIFHSRNGWEVRYVMPQ